MEAAEKEDVWNRFERTMGISWDIETLLGVKKGEKPKEVQLSRDIRIPFLMAAAPEFFKQLTDDMRKKYDRMMATQREAGGGKVIEIGNLSVAEARELFKNLGAMTASLSVPVSNDSE